MAKVKGDGIVGKGQKNRRGTMQNKGRRKGKMDGKGRESEEEVEDKNGRR